MSREDRPVPRGRRTQTGESVQASDQAARRTFLKERLLRHGAFGLEEPELLELLLSYAIPARDLRALAGDLIALFGDLRGVLRASTKELTEQGSITPHAAALIRLGGELVHRCSTDAAAPLELLQDLRETERYLVKRMRGLKEEHLLLVFLNDLGTILGEDVIGAGTVDHLVVFPRQVMERALRHNATRLIIAHNHPHGPPLPSAQDMDEAERMREILRPFDITLHDAIIVGGNRCFSILRNRPLS